MGTERLTPAVGYLRRSTEKQEASLTDQRTAIEKYAREHGYEVIRLYEDDGISGDATERRHGFLRMHADAVAPRRDFDVILCWNYSRFGRFNSIEAGFWIHPLMKAGVKLVTTDKGLVNWNDFIGRVINTLEAEGKHQFLRDLARDVIRGQISNAEAGRLNGQRAPYGYDRVLIDDRKQVVQRVRDGERIARPKTWKIGLELSDDPEKVRWAKWMFTTYAEMDVGTRALADHLNAKRVPGPTGGGWSQATVREILRNPVYAGDFVWGRRRMGKYFQAAASGARERTDAGAAGNPRAEWVRTTATHPALVDRPIFDRVQEKLTERQARTTPRGARGDGYLLSGLVFCGHCKRKMHGYPSVRVKNGKRYVYLRCVCSTKHTQGKNNPAGCGYNGIEQEPLVNFLATTLRTAILSGGHLDDLRARIRSVLEAKRASDPNRAAALREKAKSLEVQAGRLIRSLPMLDGPAAEAVTTELNSISTDKERTLAELAEVERAGDAADLDEQAAEMAREIWTLAEDITGDDPARVREVFRRMVGRIDLSFDKRQRKNRVETPFREGTVELRIDPVLLGLENRGERI
jgi:site-specific DNA recombinase